MLILKVNKTNVTIVSSSCESYFKNQFVPIYSFFYEFKSKDFSSGFKYNKKLEKTANNSSFDILGKKKLENINFIILLFGFLRIFKIDF